MIVLTQLRRWARRSRRHRLARSAPFRGYTPPPPEVRASVLGSAAAAPQQVPPEDMGPAGFDADAERLRALAAELRAEADVLAGKARRSPHAAEQQRMANEAARLARESEAVLARLKSQGDERRSTELELRGPRT